jgi:hypothetical protein
MEEQPEPRPGRRVRIHTVRGTVEGELRLSPHLRTLDDLNRNSRNFVMLHEPDGDGWSLDSGPVALNKSLILFVAELESFTGGTGGIGAYARAPMGFHVEEFDVRGFVHVPSNGDPFMRLSHDGAPFLAVTSASVVGDSLQFVTPFIALNRAYILAAQRMGQEVQPGAVVAVASAEP